MNRATGLDSTNAVRILTGNPRNDDTLPTFDSALVACILKVSLQ